MVFSSFVFLCFLLPAVLILHTAVRNTLLRNVLLIIASLIFYAFGEPVYIVLLLVSVAMNYGFGRWLGAKKSKGVLATAVIVNVGLLFVFKYLGFAVEQINAVTGASIPNPGLRLPIGISFYTFQALSYVIDVYRGDVKPQKSFPGLLLYISFFPQLIAGPIIRYHDVDRQIHERTVDAEGIRRGLVRFSFGLGKKILIANAAASAADTLFALGNGQWGLLSSWVAAIAYVIQIYFDFSGYSDMAIGLGRMFGFHFAENFNYPYVSGSIKEFWRRWHISLSTWFREYLYIPLGGNRKGKLCTLRNRFIVFLTTGIWHGANWTFVIWGLWHGMFLTLEQPKESPLGKCRFRPLNHIYAMLVVIIGFVIFRADTLTQAMYVIRAMFGFGASGDAGYAAALPFLAPYYLVILVLAVIAATGAVKALYRKLAAGREETMQLVAMAASVVILLLCYLQLASDSYNPFIYFRF